MGLPVDTNKIRTMTAGEPFAAFDFKSKQPKLDRNGVQLWVVPMTIMCLGQKATIVNVRVPGEPKGVQAFQYVRLHDFFFNEFDGKEGKGTFYDVGRIEPETAGKS